MEKQHTAIDFLIKHLFPNNEVFGCSNDLYKQAKKLEKQQIINAYKDSITLHGSKEWKQSEAEQYYKEKYGDEN